MSAALHPRRDPSKRSFLLRRIHSLTGVLPVGLFLVGHLWSSSRALFGQESYERHLRESREVPYALVLELVLVMLPLTFHALYGLKLAFSGKPNVGAYPESRNWMYTAQRLTGVLAFGFVVWHVSQYWVPGLMGDLHPSSVYPALCRDLSATRFGLPLAALAYVFGVGACAFHLGNGLWGFCVGWGLAVTERAQRITATVTGVLGLLLFLLGANTAIYFATGARLAILGVPPRDPQLAKALTCEHVSGPRPELPAAAPPPASAP